MRLRLFTTFACLLMAATTQAALFSGPSTFSTAPYSTVGPLTSNTLLLTDTPNGFVVTGQVTITVPPTQGAGIIVWWEVDRPLNPNYGPVNLFTTTVLDGFSLPPVGTVGSFVGGVESHFTDPNFYLPSLSSIPLSLPGGVATWSNISVNSSSFNYTATTPAPTPPYSLRQKFFFDGQYTSGSGGNWVVDVPVTTTVTTATAVPEPSSLMLAGLGAAALAVSGRVRRRRNRSSIAVR